MRVEEFKVFKSTKVSEAISDKYSMISYNTIRKLLRNKDIKVNGKRINIDVSLKVGDEIVFYINDLPENKLDVIFEDDNIIVVFKRRKIETVSEAGEYDLLSEVSSYLKSDCYAVHRLDRNTEGVVLFAKNEMAKESLDLAFKNRTIEKYYLAQVYGVLEKKTDNMVAYLKKFANKSYVDISSEEKVGYEKIQTNYKVLKEDNDTSVVEVELITGKTHQIRAHFAHVGHFVIGDEKYGDSSINKIYKKKYQCLCAYKVVFYFGDDDFLAYLNNKVIELSKSKIDFCQNL